MPKATPVIVRSQPEGPVDWRWFVAILCFIHFYVQFLTVGTSLWDHLARNAYRVQGDGYGVSYDLPFFLWSLCLWGIGRSFARKSRVTTHWLAAGALCMTGAVVSTTWLIVSANSSGSARFQNIVYWSREHAILDQNAWCLPWVAIVFVGVWYRRRARDQTNVAHRPWVVIAATWCLGQIPLVPTVGHPTEFSSAMGRVAILLPWTYTFLLASTAVLLLVHSRFARTSALAVGAIGMAVAAFGLYLSWDLTHSATGVYVWTRFTFHALCVHPVSTVGPWLLIAVFAWRIPMAPLPDDQSPYPRAFCRRCGYNLHGLEVARCPECGAEFATLPRPGRLS